MECLQSVGRKIHELEDRVNLLILSENSIVTAEEEVLSTLSILDIVSSIIVVSVIFSLLPVMSVMIFRSKCADLNFDGRAGTVLLRPRTRMKSQITSG